MWPEYTVKPVGVKSIKGKTIYFFPIEGENIDLKTVHSFGDEWTRFDSFSNEEIKKIGDEYFDICTDILNSEMQVLDAGCGTGRWSCYISKHVKSVDAIDPSEAVSVAAVMTKDHPNIRITRASIENLPFEDDTYDFVMSVGVLHHTPDCNKSIKSLVKKVKPNGHLYLYLYYNFDNKNLWYSILGRLSVKASKIIGKLPSFPKQVASDIFAIFFYLPLIGIAKLIKLLFPSRDWHTKVPLAYYINKSWNVIRNDSRDRFGTSLAHRFSKNEIRTMMENAGLTDIVFSSQAPYWHATGIKLP